MTNSASTLTRRTLLRTSALAAAATLLPESQAQNATTAVYSREASFQQTYAPATLKPPLPDTDLPIRLGIASYTFRSFPDPAKLIGFMHQLKTPLLNLKSVHLPMTSLDLVANQPKTPPQPGQAPVPPTLIPLDQVAAQIGRAHV